MDPFASRTARRSSSSSTGVDPAAAAIELRRTRGLVVACRRGRLASATCTTIKTTSNGSGPDSRKSTEGRDGRTYLDPYRTAVFTGTFDPITLGHLDVIGRGRLLFDHLVVGIGVNPNKTSLFDIEERVETGAIGGAPVSQCLGRVVRRTDRALVRRIGARVILRGLRTLSDMEYEFGMTLTNHRLDPTIDTVFLMADGEYSHVSSSLIKQVRTTGGPKR